MLFMAVQTHGPKECPAHEKDPKPLWDTEFFMSSFNPSLFLREKVNIAFWVSQLGFFPPMGFLNSSHFH